MPPLMTRQHHQPSTRHRLPGGLQRQAQLRRRHLYRGKRSSGQPPTTPAAAIGESPRSPDHRRVLTLSKRKVDLGAFPSRRPNLSLAPSRPTRTMPDASHRPRHAPQPGPRGPPLSCRGHRSLPEYQGEPERLHVGVSLLTTGASPLKRAPSARRSSAPSNFLSPA